VRGRFFAAESESRCVAPISLTEISARPFNARLIRIVFGFQGKELPPFLMQSAAFVTCISDKQGR
jgi:hypothetical protein